MIPTTTLRVGLAVGGGTGLELAAVFEKVLSHLAARRAVDIEIVRANRIYHSYASLLHSAEGSSEANLDICEETIEDARHYRQFCEEEAARGLRVIFRTAISAQALYIVREHLQAVKAEYYDLGSSSLLMIRDQAQGFYTGWNKLDANPGSLKRTCEFSKDIFRRILSFALERAGHIWGDNGRSVDSVLMVYKFHLFDGLFKSWADEWSTEYGLKVEFIQPDTMNRNLLAFGVQGNCVMIAGNEYADIMQVVLLDMFGMGTQETSWAENIYLHPEMHRLSEYQTVHGSADDIAGKGIVNPFATISAAAAILEEHAACTGMRREVDQALAMLQQQKLVTPDKGGSQTTAMVVDLLLESISTGVPVVASNGSVRPQLSTKSAATLANNGVDGSAAFLGQSSAVIVMDFQNDFVASEQGKLMGQIAANIQRVVSFARAQNTEVIWVRFLGDEVHQSQPWRYRNHSQQRQDWCIEGTWGAEIFSAVAPAANERVFDKKAHFDPFLSADFTEYMANKGYQHLILLGLYSDICVDATARTAFQKGLWTTIVRDCTAPKHLREKDVLLYMIRVYGTRVVSCDELLTMEA